MTAPETHTADVDWLAFRYAANELQGAELETFEALLATDERACAALAQAVLLTQHIVVCEQSPETSPHVVPLKTVSRTLAGGRSAGRGWLWRTAAAVSCGVASLALIVAGLTWTSSNSPQVAESATTVAALWIHGADEFSAVDVVAASNQELMDSEEEDAIPGWLLAAVNEQQQTNQDDEVMQD